MQQNIYETLDGLMQILASASSADDLVEALQSSALNDHLQDVGTGDLLLVTNLAQFERRGSSYRFVLSGKGRQPVAPGIQLEFEREVRFDFERRADGEMRFTNIKGLKTSCALGPIKFASTDMKQVCYKPHRNGVTGIAARMGRFGVPAQFKLNAEWKFAGLGC